MPDAFVSMTQGLSSPLTGGFAIAPADNVDLPQVTRQIRVTGTSGVIAVRWLDGSSTLEPVSVGDVLDWRLTRVNATGTTATGLRGYL